MNERKKGEKVRINGMLFYLIFLLVRMKESETKSKKEALQDRAKVMSQTQRRDEKEGGGINQLIGAWHKFRCGAQA